VSPTITAEQKRPETTSQTGQHVAELLGFVRKFSGKPILIKLGGSALQDTEVVTGLCEDIALLQSVGIPVVLVHGGGPAINEELTLRGIKWEFFEGQRVTTPEMMSVVEMVLCGKVNRRIVRALNAAGVNAVGVSGTDARLLQCDRVDERLGEVGKVTHVNSDFLAPHLKGQRDGAPVGTDVAGRPLNINADWAASRLARALGIQKLIYLTDQDGILNGDGDLIAELDAGDLEDLIHKEIVKGGMLAKVRTILDGLAHGIGAIHILNGKRRHVLIEELFTNRGVGTVCRSQAVRTQNPGENSYV
jgi:acetylglutamate kinase